MKIKFLPITTEDARIIFPQASSVINIGNGCLIFLNYTVDNQNVFML